MFLLSFITRENRFQLDFNRTYSEGEDQKRLKLFEETLLQIEQHNEKFVKGLVEVEAGLNEYSDWTFEEKTKLLQ